MTRGLLKTNAEELISHRKGKTNGDQTIHKFPVNIGSHGTLMHFFEYTYGGVKGGERLDGHKVMLPLPKQINDSFKINVGGDEIGILGTGAANLVGLAQDAEAAKSVGSSFVDSIGKGIDSIAGFATGQKDAVAALSSAMDKASNTGLYLAKAGLGKVAPDILAGVGQGKGNAVNPFASLVFKGVDLKVHSLEWLLSPESEEEQRELKDIIKIIQSNILPEATSPLGNDAEGQERGMSVMDKGILRYPSMVNIYLMGVDQEYYFRFKTSMISQFNVDYTPNGLAVNKGGKPSAIRITMTLNEAFIHTKGDVDKYPTTEIQSVPEKTEQVLEDSADNVDNAEDSDTVNSNPTGQIPTDAPVQSSDEVTVTNTLPTGETVETTMPITEAVESTGKTQEQLASSTNPVYRFPEVPGGF